LPVVERLERHLAQAGSMRSMLASSRAVRSRPRRGRGPSCPSVHGGRDPTPGGTAAIRRPSAPLARQVRARPQRDDGQRTAWSPVLAIRAALRVAPARRSLPKGMAKPGASSRCGEPQLSPGGTQNSKFSGDAPPGLGQLMTRSCGTDREGRHGAVARAHAASARLRRISSRCFEA
jgi:hypothetical protein